MALLLLLCYVSNMLSNFDVIKAGCERRVASPRMKAEGFGSLILVLVMALTLAPTLALALVLEL